MYASVFLMALAVNGEGVLLPWRMGAGLFVGFAALFPLIALAVFQNRVDATFVVTPEGYEVHGGSKVRKVNRAVLALAVLSRRPGTVGAAMLASAGESTKVSWRDVTRTFVIRGFVSNTISVTYNGSDLRLNVQYEDDSGAKVAGGDGQASPSSAAPAAAPGAGGTTETGGDDIAGMTPDQLTRAANAAIIAILAGLLAGGLGVAGAEAAGATASGGGASPDGATAPSGPVDSGLRDPDTGEAIPAWESKYEAPTGGGRQGQPGDVWYGGGWMPAAEAAAAIQATLDRRAEQAARDERYKTEGQARNRQLDEAAHTRQLEADATARAERDARDNAVGVAKEEARIELRKTIKAGMERNAQIAERQKAKALTLQRLGAAASAVGTAADVGVDVISNYCGLPGEVGNAGYKGLKGFFGKVAEGQSFGDAAKHGVAEAAVEAIGGLVQRKLGAALKIPDLRNTAVNSRLYTRTVVTASGGVEKRLRSWTGRGIVTTVTGELFETPVDEAMKKMGWKQPND